MAKKRKGAPSSQQSSEQKLKTVREEIVKEEEEEDPSEEEEPSEAESSSESEEEEQESSSSEEEPNDDASKRETLRQLLEPFGKSQIIDLVKEAAAKDPKILSQIVRVADVDPTHRNVFVRGLGWDATAEQLADAFKPYGEIEESKLITDKATGRAKGYAFVLFKTRAAAKKALKSPQKKIGSRNVSCQLAAAGVPAGAGAGAAADGGNRKIYIGNVGAHVNPENLKSFFARFGEIEEGPFGMDQVTNKFKGFAIITYKTPEGYKKAMEEPIKVFDNCQLHCKKFLENLNKNNVAVPAQNNMGNAMNNTVAVTPDAGYGGGVMGANSNTGFMGGNLSGNGLLMAQNQGMGMAGNAMMGYNPTGFNPPFGGLSGNYGISNMAAAPSVIGNYGSQAALHGLGAFQNNQTVQSSVGTGGTAIAATRAPTTGVSAPTSYTSYFKR